MARHNTTCHPFNLLKVWVWTWQSVDIDLRMGRVSLVILVSDNQIFTPEKIWGCQGSVARSVAQMVGIWCFRMSWKLSEQWWKEWHVVQLGQCHVDRYVKVHVERHVGEGPTYVTEFFKNSILKWKLYLRLLNFFWH